MRPRSRWRNPSHAWLVAAVACVLEPQDTTGVDQAESGTDSDSGANGAEQAQDDYQSPLAPSAEAGACHTPDCCTLSTVTVGTESADTLTGVIAAECLVGLGGRDALSGNGGSDEILAGDGDDALNGGPGNDILAGGFGDDTVLGGDGNDRIFGGPGDDDLRGDANDDLIVPGSGADLVDAGAGNDVVVIYDVCSLQSGETLGGGSGTDTLRTPYDVAMLQRFGVTVTGFETIVVDPTRACEEDCTPPCDDVLDEFVGLPDPRVWSVDAASGLRFRRTTATERTANLWEPGSYLIENPTLVAQAAAGTTNPDVRLPISDSVLETFTMSWDQSTSSVKRLDRHLEAGQLVASVTTPTIHSYFQRLYDPAAPGPVGNAWMEMTSTDDGDIFVRGIHDGKRLELSGTNPGWSISPIPVPRGQPPIDEQSVLLAQYNDLGWGLATAWNPNQCNNTPLVCEWECGIAPCGDNDNVPPPAHCQNGDDDDNDDAIDTGDPDCQHHDEFSCNQYGPHSHSWESGEKLVLFGDGRFCTHHTNWFTRLVAAGWDTEAVLNTFSTFDPNVLPPEKMVHFLYVGCWVFEDVHDAIDCTATGTNCPAAFAQYPYKSAGQTASNYYGKVWNDVAHGGANGLDQGMTLAHVLHYGLTGLDDQQQETEFSDMACAAGDTTCCGAMSKASCAWVGGSVSMYRSDANTSCVPAYAWKSIAHECGHSLGLEHDNITIGPEWEGSGTATSFMNSSSGRGVGLCPANATRLDGALVDIRCPRPAGFEAASAASCTETEQNPYAPECPPVASCL